MADLKHGGGAARASHVVGQEEAHQRGSLRGGARSWHAALLSNLSSEFMFTSEILALKSCLALKS